MSKKKKKRRHIFKTHINAEKQAERDSESQRKETDIEIDMQTFVVK